MTIPIRYGPNQTAVLANDNSKGVTASQTHRVEVENLGAGVDIDKRPILTCPTGYVMELTAAFILPYGASDALDAGNTCAVMLANGNDAIVTATYVSDETFPAVTTSLGTLHATRKMLDAGETLNLSVTNGTAADPPAFALQLEIDKYLA